MLQRDELGTTPAAAWPPEVLRWLLSEAAISKAKPVKGRSAPLSRQPTPSASEQRRERLRSQLCAAVHQLKAHRADLIGDTLIDDLVALDWLEWQGGHLQLTVVGANVCRQSALDAAAPQA